MSKTVSGESDSFFAQLASQLLTSIPVLTALVFFVVSIKVFRVAHEETSTTVAIVRTADLVALLKGVVLTVLPGFFAAGVAATLWWWADAIPADEALGPDDAKHAMLNPRSGLAWFLLGISFFTLPWPLFIVLFGTMLIGVVWLWAIWRGKKPPSRLVRVHKVMTTTAAAIAIATIGLLAILPTVWLPQQAIELKPGEKVEVGGTQLPRRFGAYVLRSDESRTSLLLDSPRAVVEVETDAIEGQSQLCVPKQPSTRWLYLRLSQLIRIEEDYGTPYSECPR